MVNWDQPVFRFLFCVCCLAGFMAIMGVGLMLTARSPYDDQTIPIRPKAIVDLKDYSIKKSRTGEIQISEMHFMGDEPIGPLHILSAALRKYPNAHKFKLIWGLSYGSSWSSDKVIYNRDKSILIFDEESGMAGSGRRKGFYGKNHFLYSEVSDELIHKAAERSKGIGQNDGGFRYLHNFGAKITPRAK